MLMKSRLTVFAATALALLGTTSLGGQPRPEGYLAQDAIDIVKILPAAPQAGDARDKADRAIFRATRKLVGTPRWDLATSDVALKPTDLAHDFSCSLGTTLTSDNAPRTMALLARASIDTGRESQKAKVFFHRKRPYQVDRGRICQSAEELKDSPDYPSGHTTLGWTWATILAQLAPDHATALLARGREFGESRVVCGVHNESAVEAGRITAAATLAVVAGTQAFRDDLAAARAELAALRANAAPPDSATCEAEAAVLARAVP